MSPPELATDTPVLDVLHPVAVGVLELGRVQADLILHHCIEGWGGKTLHTEEPLHRELRLDGDKGALGVPNLVGVGLDLLQKSCCH